MNKSTPWLQVLFVTTLFALVAVWPLACIGEHQARAEHATATVSNEHAGHGHEIEKADEHADHEGETADEHADHEGETADEHADHEVETADEHAGHDHDSGGDLDKGVAELFAADCEHGVKTHQCDECRYEVGVVKVPADLIDRGLIAVAEIVKHDFDSKLGLTGEIQFTNQGVAHLGPRVPGVIRQVNVDIGDKVKAGQTLVVLESVELAESQAAYLEALAVQVISQKGYDRQKKLHEQKISSGKDFLAAQQQFESANIQTNSAKQKLLRMGLSAGSVSRLAKAGHSAATGRLPVVAPFKGEVLELHAVRGERVEPGDEMVMFGDTSSLWVWIDIYESQLSTIKATMTEAGLPVTVSVRAWPDEFFSGRVDYVGNVMAQQTRTVKARVVLENPHGKLKPGMFAKVAIDLTSAKGRTAAPVTAVVSDDDRHFVFVRHKDDFFVRRAVTTGRQAGGFVELLQGVTEGQTIVVAGTFLLKSDVLRSKMGAGCAH